jgi:hypothetical protein
MAVEEEADPAVPPPSLTLLMERTVLILVSWAGCLHAIQEHLSWRSVTQGLMGTLPIAEPKVPTYPSPG